MTVPTSEPEIVLSLSRLLSRVLVSQPSGVDRVELAYARELMRQAPDRLRFSAWNPMFHRYGRLSDYWIRRYVDRLEQRWNTGQRRSPIRRRIDAFWWMVMLLPLPVPRRMTGRRRVLIQSSPDQLDRPALMKSIVRREGDAFIALVHDLIPIEHPEYARPGGEALHRRRMTTLRTLADALIANSAATATSFSRIIAHDPARIIRVAPLGTHTSEDGDRETGRRPPVFTIPTDPYFVCLGTIEPRKNHLLLLNVWRRIAEGHGTPPRLLIIGKRGWENENIIDMLERCPAVVAHVDEINDMSDADVGRALAGARALLLPSFAEGYGMPVSEALAIGTPVLCSDLPALREAGGNAAEYLDPLDGPEWMKAILDYVDPASSRRGLALGRIAEWRAPDWVAHISIVLQLAHEVTL